MNLTRILHRALVAGIMQGALVAGYGEYGDGSELRGTNTFRNAS